VHSLPFKQFLRLTLSGMHIYFKIDTIHGARRYAARACGAYICHRECIVYLSNIIKIDTFRDA
jgi:hypothetical protein